MRTHKLLLQFQHFVQQLLDLLYPEQCTICKKGGAVLCSSCLASIQPSTSPMCPHCSSTHLWNGICQDCRRQPLRLHGLRAVSTYKEPLRTCIHELKYTGNTRLAKPLGTLLAQVFTTSDMQADMIIPVPLHSKRQRERGYNQARLLAEVCAEQLAIPMYDSILVRTRATISQVSLGAADRQSNVAGAFECSTSLATSALRGRRIIIIDDVCSTGSTLEACAKPLYTAGALSVWGLVLARPV